MDIIAKAARALLTANGSTTGYATVADNSVFPLGALLWISSNSVAGKECLVTEHVGSTQVGLRFTNPVPMYGRNNLSAYLVADSAVLNMTAQVVPEEPSTGGGLTPTGVTPGSYTAANITVNSFGQITAASNGAGGGGISALTGDVTASGAGSVVATIAANAVTYAKMQTQATATILGNNTGSTGVPLALTAAQTKTLLAISTSDVSGLGTLATQNGTFSGTSSGTNTGDQTITLTGDVTGSGTGSFAATIANSAVTLAKIANIAASTILGNNTVGAAAPIALTAAQTKTLLSLNLVENTALSTWPGTTNVTTLGTIATGTWSATAIADNKIASALTGKTYNGLTLTALATGFTVAGGTTSKTLTVPLDASVSGTNTGDQDLSSFSTKALAINAQTSSYTLVLTDKDNKYVRMTSATVNSLTVPTNASVAFPIGTQIPIRQAGAGQTTIIAAGGVTVNTGLTLKLRTQGSSASLIKVDTNEWDLAGDLEAP